MSPRTRWVVWGLACLFLSLPSARAHDTALGSVEATFEKDGRYLIEVRVAAAPLLRRLELADRERLPRAESHRELQRRLEGRQVRILEAMEIRFDDEVASPQLKVEIVDPTGPSIGSGSALEAILSFSGDLPKEATQFTLMYSLATTAYPLVLHDEIRDRVVTQWVDIKRASEPFEFAGATPSTWQVARQYLELGFTHIIPKGLDHILFVLGIFLFSYQLRPVVIQVTAFTVAHTLTLGLSIFGVLSLSSALVEPLIALSIVYVAIENILGTRLSAWRVTVVFAFGLLHGLGFAGVLQDLGLPQSQFITALLGFNIGVEVGQLVVIGIAFALCSWARHRPWYRRRIVVPASLAIAATGLVWAVQRILPGAG